VLNSFTWVYVIPVFFSQSTSSGLEATEPSRLKDVGADSRSGGRETGDQRWLDLTSIDLTGIVLLLWLRYARIWEAASLQ
jgi:hypothetical protein